MQHNSINSTDHDRQKLQVQKPLAAPLPSDPTEAAAVVMAAILDPNAQMLPGDIFKELARRNAAIVDAPETEIKATLSRQIAILEATSLRLFKSATTARTTAAANEFLRNALATQRVLIASLGAIHAMGGNGGGAVLVHDQGHDHADE